MDTATQIGGTDFSATIVNNKNSNFSTVTQKATNVIKKKCIRYGAEVASGLALAYLAGPYVAVVTRAAFPYVYRVVFGPVPELYEPSYWITYTPMLEHASGYAYNNGTFILSTANTVLITAAKVVPVAVNFAKEAVVSTASTISNVVSFLWNKGSSNKTQKSNSDLGSDSNNDVNLQDKRRARTASPMVVRHS